MFITFSDGRKVEGVTYSQTGSTMRVAASGSDDLIDFTCISGQWVSENCEPVEIEFAWQRTPMNERVTEADCICPQALASRLIERMLKPSADDEIKRLVAGDLV